MTNKEKQIIIDEYASYKRAMHRYIEQDDYKSATEASMAMAVIGNILDNLKINRPQ